MTLEKRARRLAGAAPGDSIWRNLVAAVSVSVIALVFAVRPDLWPAAIGAGILFGMTQGRDPERYYLEGFSDGLAAADALRAAGGSADDGRPARDVGELPESTAADGERARRHLQTVRPSDRGLGADPTGSTVDDLAGALGVDLPARPARHALDGEGRPIPRVLAGPQRVAPIIPGALSPRPAGSPPADGPEAGGQTGALGGETPATPVTVMNVDLARWEE